MVTIPDIKNCHVAIRVDASLQIGSGHVMRCLTLAEELRRQTTEIIFICREHDGHLCDLIEERGFAVLVLPKASDPDNQDWNRHAEWLQVSLEQDARQTLEVLEGQQPLDWLIVDHYAIDQRWENSLRAVTRNIMVIDDLADRHHDCDLLLDQNYYKGAELRYRGLLPESCTQLLGPKYALLRPDFAQTRQRLRKREDAIQRLFVFLGGADVDNVTGKILEAFIRLGRSDLTVDVVVGGTNPHRKAIQELCLQHSNLNYHCQVSNIADLMASADLAVAAGGSTTWERCCLGLPTLVVATADNQMEMCAYGAEQGLFHLLGRAEQLSVDDYCAGLSIFTTTFENLSAFSCRGLALVDGKGGQRVCSAMMPPEIIVRLAVVEDCDSMHAWRNAEETRKHIFDPQSISLAKHRSWYADILEDPDRYLLVGELENRPVGVFRIDSEGEYAKISMYLVPGLSGQGLGSWMADAFLEWVQQNLTQVKWLIGEIMPENLKCLKIFASRGFVEHHREIRKQIRQ